jgi:hypothetical protein
LLPCHRLPKHNRIDLDAFTALLKASGFEGDPEAKVVIDALTRKKNNTSQP